MLFKTFNANAIVDKLENGSSLENKSLPIFNKDYRTRHHNTYLLQALAWNRLNAALNLLELDKNKESLDLKDDWMTCLNTPLILAAKINAEKVVEKLLFLGANVHAQDYRGYTALHYACMLRNDKIIKSLIAAKANIQMMDAFGRRPCDYYRMKMTKEDLQYRYGKVRGYLNPVADKDKHYFATQKKCLSALRWYIPHIIVNNNLGQSESVGNVSLYHYACSCLQIREPVYHADAYEAMMHCFLTNRPKMNSDLATQLSNVSINIYQDEQYDRYQLDPLDLVPHSAIHKDENDQVWVELQELKYRK